MDGHSGSWPTAIGPDGKKVDLTGFPQKSDRMQDYSVLKNQKEGWYAITNQRIGLGWGVLFSKEVFRYLWYWQSFGGGYGYPWYGRTYNVGLEPFTSYTNEGLDAPVQNGTAITMEPGQRIEVSLKAIAYTGSERVERINLDGSLDRRA